MPICLRLIIKTPSLLKHLKANQIKWQLKASYTLSYLRAYHLWKLAISGATLEGNVIWAGIFSWGVWLPPSFAWARVAPPGAPVQSPGEPLPGAGAQAQGGEGRDLIPTWKLLGPVSLNK